MKLDINWKRRKLRAVSLSYLSYLFLHDMCSSSTVVSGSLQSSVVGYSCNCNCRFAYQTSLVSFIVLFYVYNTGRLYNNSSAVINYVMSIPLLVDENILLAKCLSDLSEEFKTSRYHKSASLGDLYKWAHMICHVEQFNKFSRSVFSHILPVNWLLSAVHRAVKDDLNEVIFGHQHNFYQLFSA